MREPDLNLLVIEATNRCDMQCVMCPSHGAALYQGQADNHPKNIDVGFFKRIVDQYAALKQRGYKSIIPQFQGEPLLHPDFIELCRYIDQKGILFSFTTNGSTLTDTRARELLKLERFFGIMFSVDGATKETYEKVRVHGKWESVRTNIQRFIEINKQERSTPISVGVSFTLQPENAHELDKMISDWMPLVDCVSVNNVAVKGRASWFHFYPEAPREACGDLWHFMVVLTNGQVVPCCRDALYQFDMGNLNNNTLEEVWRGHEYQRMREQHERGQWNEIPLCADCDTWMCRTTKRVTERFNQDVVLIKGPFFMVAKHA